MMNLAPCLAALALAASGPTTIRIAVMEIEAEGVPPEAARGVGGVITSSLHRLGIFEVISREDVQNILLLEQDKRLLGCEDAACLADVGGALGARYLLSGRLARVGERFVLTLTLVDIREIKAAQSATQETARLAEMVAAAREAVTRLVGGILSEHRGQLSVFCREAGAEVHLDGDLVGLTPLGLLAVPAGPHLLELKKEGFVRWVRQIRVEPELPTEAEVLLMPSPEFAAEYRSGALWQQAGGWIAVAVGGLSLALAGGAGIRYLQLDGEYVTLENQRTTDVDFTRRTRDDYAREYDRVLDEIDTWSTVGYVGLGAGAAALGVGLYLLLTGEDPDRYEHLELGTAGPGGVKAGFRF